MIIIIKKDFNLIDRELTEGKMYYVEEAVKLHSKHYLVAGDSGKHIISIGTNIIEVII